MVRLSVTFVALVAFAAVSARPTVSEAAALTGASADDAWLAALAALGRRRGPIQRLKASGKKGMQAAMLPKLISSVLWQYSGAAPE
jgi:hypothetical protein